MTNNDYILFGQSEKNKDIVEKVNLALESTYKIYTRLPKKRTFILLCVVS